MSHPFPTDAVELTLLHQLFAAATHDASAAMCRWTDGLITLSLDEVCEIPLEEVCQQMAVGDELVTMVVLSLAGHVGGEMILTFDEEDGRRLVAGLLGAEASAAGPWTPLEQSALCETGNILGCAYMNALTRLIDVELVPSPPMFLQDYAASVLQQALAPQALTADHALICRTVFHRSGVSLNWRVFFVPTAGMRQALQVALHAAP